MDENQQTLLYGGIRDAWAICCMTRPPRSHLFTVKTFNKHFIIAVCDKRKHSLNCWWWNGFCITLCAACVFLTRNQLQRLILCVFFFRCHSYPFDCINRNLVAFQFQRQRIIIYIIIGQCVWYGYHWYPWHFDCVVKTFVSSVISVDIVEQFSTWIFRTFSIMAN